MADSVTIRIREDEEEEFPFEIGKTIFGTISINNHPPTNRYFTQYFLHSISFADIEFVLDNICVSLRS